MGGLYGFFHLVQAVFRFGLCFCVCCCAAIVRLAWLVGFFVVIRVAAQAVGCRCLVVSGWGVCCVGCICFLFGGSFVWLFYFFSASPV